MLSVSKDYWIFFWCFSRRIGGGEVGVEEGMCIMIAGWVDMMRRMEGERGGVMGDWMRKTGRFLGMGMGREAERDSLGVNPIAIY